MSTPDLDARLAGLVGMQRNWAVVRAWRATRLPWVRFAALAFLLAWAASVGAPFQQGVAALKAVLALALVAQLRFWDDLADIDQDRRHHPERVLARCADARIAVAACALLGGMCALALYALHGPPAAIGYGLLCLVLGAWYRLHSARGTTHAHVLLLKYPAIVVLLASPASAGWALGCAAAVVYAAMCAFELVDRDAVLPSSSRLVLGVHAFVAGAAALGPHVDTSGLVAATVASIAILAADRGFVALPACRYLPFLAAVVVLIRYSIGGNA